MISVIIPSYNSHSTIRPCLEAVLGQDLDENYEVIVVDSSSDQTSGIIRSHFPGVHLIHTPGQLFPGEARNIGLKAASGDLLAFTDSDCLPDSQWLKTIREAHQSSYLIIGGSISNGRPSSFVAQAEYFIEFREFSEYSPRREVRFIPTCNLSAKLRLFDHAGLFPRVRASEDTLFAHHLQELGIPILFVPQIHVQHLNRDRLRPFLRNQWILGENAAQVRRLTPMPGCSFAKIPLLIPVLPLVRAIRTIQFIFKNSFRQALSQLARFALVYPYFFLGSVWWSLGFYSGVRSPGNRKSLFT